VTELFCRCRKEGAERSGVASAGSDVSFIEQIGSAGTEPNCGFRALPDFSARCDFPQAPPGGSRLSRAPISGATVVTEKRIRSSDGLDRIWAKRQNQKGSFFGHSELLDSLVLAL